MEFPSAQFKNNADASTGFLFIRTYNKWHTNIKNGLRKKGITHPQFIVLTTLNYLSQSDEAVTQANIAKMADMDVMSVSQILRGLEEKGYLSRTEHPKDPRANAVRLLPKGCEAVKICLPLVEKIDENYFGALAAEEEVFQELLRRLLD